MDSVYSRFKNINQLSVKDRIEAFKQSALLMLQGGYSVESIKKAAEQCEEDEMYEAVQGVLLALADFQKQPQMSLSLELFKKK